MKPPTSKKNPFREQTARATGLTWIALLGVVGIFAMFKGPNAWWAEVFEVLAFLALAGLLVMGFLWIFACIWGGGRGRSSSRKRPRVLEGVGPRNGPPEEEILEEAATRKLPEEKLLAYKKWTSFLSHAADRVRNLPHSNLDGDSVIGNIDLILYQALDKPLPLFLVMYESPYPGADFRLRDDAFMAGSAFLLELLSNARPWALPAGVSLDLFDAEP